MYVFGRLYIILVIFSNIHKAFYMLCDKTFINEVKKYQMKPLQGESVDNMLIFR
jgi:hypothetical protein